MTKNWWTRWMTRQTRRPIRRNDVGRTRLGFETFEERVVPAAFSVTNTNDAGAGSLRQAILDLNSTGTAGSSSTANTITFAGNVFRTINVPCGSVLVAKSVTIDGPGAALVTVNNTVAGNRVFTVDDADPLNQIGVEINGLKITGGKSAATGGGVFSNGEQIKLVNVELLGNIAATGGGGVASKGGLLTIEASTISDNTATAGDGGGVQVDGGVANITTTKIERNDAPGNGGGVGVSTVGTNVTIDNSVIRGNGDTTPAAQGGGIGVSGNVSNTTLTVTNTAVIGNNAALGGGVYVGEVVSRFTNVTIGENTASGLGGGFYYDTAGATGSATLLHVTIAKNVAPATSGGGLWIDDGSNAADVTNGLKISNTIITDNGALNAPNAVAGDNLDTGGPTVNVAQSKGNLVFEASPAAGLTDGALNQVVATQKANLSSLAFNGGFTPTYGFLAGSTAVDRGVTGANLPTGVTLPTTDQRVLFNRVYGVAPDVGAYEKLASASQQITLNATQIGDEFDANLSTGLADLSLREALLLAGTDAPVVNATGLNGTVALSLGSLQIRGDATVTGSGAGTTIVDGGGKMRVFVIDDGAATVANVSLAKMTITGGGTTGGGAAILARENLTLDSVVVNNNIANVNDGITQGGAVAVLAGSLVTIRDSQFTGNQAAVLAGMSDGGALYVDSAGASVNVTNSSFVNNTATRDGGAIEMRAATVNISNSTFAGNTANNNGGAIDVFAGAFLTLSNSTIAFNKADADGVGGGTGGGLFLAAGTTNDIVSSVIAKNTVGTIGNQNDISGQADYRFSLVGTQGGTFTPGANSNNNLTFGTDPQFTSSTPAAAGGNGTLLLLPTSPTSPLIDAGSNPLALTTDQRGTPFARVIGSAADIGAAEVQAVPSAGTIAVNPATYTIAENGGALVITVERTGGSSGTVSVQYATGGGTAVPGTDYTTTTGTLTWVNGDTAPKQIVVPILDDTAADGNKTFDVTLSNAMGGATLGTAVATVTITDNDGPVGGNPLVAASFSSGVWVRGTNGLWTNVTSVQAEQIYVTANGDLVGVFNSGAVTGVWRRTASTGTWVPLTSVQPDEIQVLDNGTIVGDFGAIGVWTATATGGFTQIEGNNPADIDVAQDGTIFASYSAGPIGVWRYTGGAWGQINTLAATNIEASNATAAAGVFAGIGTWKWTNGTWTEVSAAAAEQIVSNTTGTFFGDFGTLGVYSFSPTTGATALAGGADAQELTVSGNGDLFGDFGAIGIWRAVGGTGFAQISTFDPSDIDAGNSGQLAAAFAPVSTIPGIWIYLPGTGFGTSAATPEVPTSNVSAY